MGSRFDWAFAGGVSVGMIEPHRLELGPAFESAELAQSSARHWVRCCELANRPNLLPVRPRMAQTLRWGLAIRGCAPRMGTGVETGNSAMTMQTISTAIERVTAVLRRRPEFGLHAD